MENQLCLVEKSIELCFQNLGIENSVMISIRAGTVNSLSCFINVLQISIQFPLEWTKRFKCIICFINLDEFLRFIYANYDLHFNILNEGKTFKSLEKNDCLRQIHLYERCTKICSIRIAQTHFIKTIH